MSVPFPDCPVEAFVYGASVEDAALVGFEINHFASEKLCDLWHKCRRIAGAGDTPTDLLAMAVEQQALRVMYARRRYSKGSEAAR